MSSAGRKRPFLELIQEAGRQSGLEFEAIVPNFIYRVIYGDLHFLMYNVDLGLNLSSACSLAKSKSSAYAVLAAAGVPAVEHQFLPYPKSRFSDGSAYILAEEYYEAYQGDVVVKQDEGAQGLLVFRATRIEDLHRHLDQIYQHSLGAAISPYYESQLEYRITVLNNRAMLGFAKSKTTDWKHNLSQGAIVTPISDEQMQMLSPLAESAAQAIGLRFCTVDLLDTAQGLRVLEVNGTVFLSEYIRMYPAGADRVKAIYQEAFQLKINELKKC